MKYKIVRVYIIDEKGKRTCIKLNKTVQDIEQLRKTIRDQHNAKMVLFYIEELSE